MEIKYRNYVQTLFVAVVFDFSIDIVIHNSNLFKLKCTDILKKLN